LGDARAAEKSRTAAETAYRQAAAVRPQDPTPYLRLTCLYLDWNRLNEGMAALGAAEEREADPREIAALRAFLYAARGDWEQAVAWAERALAQGDDRPTIRLLARGYLWLGREDAALAAYQALVEDDPDNPEFREHLGFLLALTDPSAALPHLRAASTPLSSDLIAALDEAPARRLARMGQIALARGEPALAARALERAVSQDPTSADARALLGHALALLGRSDAARTHLETAVREAPDSPLARSLLGLYYLRQGNFAAARPHLEAAYDLDPQNPALALYLASLYANLGEYAAADIWLAEATRLAPEDPAVWETVARFYLERRPGDPRGVEAARALVRLAPERGEVRALLGRALLFTGDIAGAEEELRRALELSPDLASAHAALGRLYALQGRWDLADEEFLRALDLNTDPQLRLEIERMRRNR
jgi:tetratricopeptide (TPR) repeat protein